MRVALHGLRRVPTTSTSAHTIRGAHLRHSPLLSLSHFSSSSTPALTTVGQPAPEVSTPQSLPPPRRKKPQHNLIPDVQVTKPSVPSPDVTQEVAKPLKKNKPPKEWYSMLKKGHGGLDDFMDHPDDQLDPPPGTVQHV